MKKKLVIFLICAFALASVGCTSGSGDTSGESQEAEKVVETAEDDKMTAEEEPAHEHKSRKKGKLYALCNNLYYFCNY